MPTVGQFSEWNAKQGVENTKRGPVKETDLIVAQPEVFLYILSEDRDDIAVNKVQNIHDDEHAKCIP